jgi:hypothetical protein
MKKSLIVFGIGTLIAGSVITGVKIRDYNKKKDILNKYEQLMLMESGKTQRSDLTTEDSVDFYANHDLMEHTTWNYSDLTRGDINRWEFEPATYSEMERIVKEYYVDKK